MSIRANPKKAVPALLNRLKKTTETHQDDPLAEDQKKIEEIKEYINGLKKQFPAAKQWEEELLDQFSVLDRRYRKVERLDFNAIHADLTQTNNLLFRLAAKPESNRTDQGQGKRTWQNGDGFQALSPLEQMIIADPDNPIVKRLRVSYDFLHRLDGLDPRRLCLLFLAIFPENAVLRKRFLIYWRIGEGLVPNEEEGERIFEDLLELELIIPHRTDKCPRVNKCQIHPWIRYMLITVATREELLHLLHNEIPCFDPSYSRRTCLIADRQRGSEIEAFVSATEIETLRTIFNVNESFLDFPREWLGKFKRLVALQLGRWQVSPIHHIEVQDESFLTGLKTQKHLKYLSLRGISRIIELPSTITELVNLEILDLKACHNLETLPSGITSLRKLTHLDVSECYLLESMPKGLEKLTSLKVLKGFIIGNSQKTPVRIEHLRKLEKLERLSIHVGSEAVIQDNEFEKLKDLKEVKCLKISWGVVRKDQVLKESVSFPPKLEKLDLEGIPHDRTPEWLKPSKLKKLEKLYIKGGELKSLDHDDTEQWKVKILLLKYTKKLRIDLQTVRIMFPSLQYVKKVGWEEEDDTSETSGVEFIEFEWNQGSVE